MNHLQRIGRTLGILLLVVILLDLILYKGFKESIPEPLRRRARLYEASGSQVDNLVPFMRSQPARKFDDKHIRKRRGSRVLLPYQQGDLNNEGKVPPGSGLPEPMQLVLAYDERGYPGLLDISHALETKNVDDVRPRPHSPDVLVIGDSFVEGIVVPRPLPTLLTERFDLGFYNAGCYAYGVEGHYYAFRRLSAELGTKRAILCITGGNTIRSLARVLRKGPHGVEGDARRSIYRFWLFPFSRALLEEGRQGLTTFGQGQLFPPPSPAATAGAPSLGSASSDEKPEKDARYKYPAELTLAGKKVPFAFLERRVGQLFLGREDLERSIEGKTLVRLLDAYRDAAEEQGVDLAICYLPNKPEVYIPYLKAEELAPVVADIRGDILLSEGGFTAPGPFLTREDVPALQENAPALRNFVADYCREREVPFFDVLGALEPRAKAGEVLFYTFDTHMNQTGYQRALEGIAPDVEAWLRE